MLSLSQLITFPRKTVKANSWVSAKPLNSLRGGVRDSATTNISFIWKCQTKGIVDPVNDALLGTKIRGQCQWRALYWANRMALSIDK